MIFDRLLTLQTNHVDVVVVWVILIHLKGSPILELQTIKPVNLNNKPDKQPSNNNKTTTNNKQQTTKQPNNQTTTYKLQHSLGSQDCPNILGIVVNDVRWNLRVFELVFVVVELVLIDQDHEKHLSRIVTKQQAINKQTTYFVTIVTH
jgi:hypothetical protein